MLLAKSSTRVEENVVRAIPEPEFTDTWHPIAHHKVIDSLESACDNIGLGVTKREYSLDKTGARMFGVWNLDYINDGKCYSLGFRNSLNKTMVVGIVGGFKVFVCDNLVLSGEFLTFSKHTKGLDMDRLADMCDTALEGAFFDMERLENWYEKLGPMYIKPKTVKAITYDLMNAGAFPPSQFKRFQEMHEEEIKTVYGYPVKEFATLKTVHGACTRLMRGSSLFQVSERNKNLIKVCDDYVERIAA